VHRGQMQLVGSLNKTSSNDPYGQHWVLDTPHGKPSHISSVGCSHKQTATYSSLCWLIVVCAHHACSHSPRASAGGTAGPRHAAPGSCSRGERGRGPWFSQGSGAQPTSAGCQPSAANYYRVLLGYCPRSTPTCLGFPDIGLVMCRLLQYNQ
jgi:hypothetical protein